MLFKAFFFFKAGSLLYEELQKSAYMPQVQMMI